MTVKILLGPGESHFSGDDYARTYNFLRTVRGDITIDAIVGNSHINSINEGNVSLTSIAAQSKLKYRALAYENIWSKVSTGEFDVYHDVNMNYPDWNPILFQDIDSAVLLGPCEAGHIVSYGAFHEHLTYLIGRDLPRSVTTLPYKIFQKSNRMASPAREYLFKKTLDGADHLVAVNKATKSHYQEYTDTPTTVIPYGVNTDRLTFSERRKTDQILAVGTLIERKGFAYLIKALPEIRSAISNVTLHIVGTGPQREHLENLSHQLDVADSVRFHGYLDQESLQTRFRKAQLFVHPSLSEGYSHIRLEAMASGCPVVGTDVRGAREMIRDGKDGTIVPCGSVDSLADAIIPLLRDVERARAMGRSARDRIEERHMWPDISAKYVDLYESLIDE